MTKNSVKNDLYVKIEGLEVTFLKNSNVYKIGEETYYLKQIVWEKVTEEVIDEVKKYLQK